MERLELLREVSGVRWLVIIARVGNPGAVLKRVEVLATARAHQRTALSAHGGVGSATGRLSSKVR